MIDRKTTIVVGSAMAIALSAIQAIPFISDWKNTRTITGHEFVAEASGLSFLGFSSQNGSDRVVCRVVDVDKYDNWVGNSPSLLYRVQFVPGSWDADLPFFVNGPPFYEAQACHVRRVK